MRPLRWLKEKILEAVPAILFFLIAFNLITLTENLMLSRKYGHDTDHYYALASIGALLVGKLLIILNSFSFVNAFPHRPLIYNIVWKIVIYNVFALLFRLMHHFIHHFFEYKSGHAAYELLLNEVSAHAFWAIQLWVLMTFIVYVVGSEFTRVLGVKEVKRLLFGFSRDNSSINPK